MSELWSCISEIGIKIFNNAHSGSLVGWVIELHNNPRLKKIFILASSDHPISMICSPMKNWTGQHCWLQYQRCVVSFHWSKLKTYFYFSFMKVLIVCINMMFVSIRTVFHDIMIIIRSCNSVESLVSWPSWLHDILSLLSVFQSPPSSVIPYQTLEHSLKTNQIRSLILLKKIFVKF